MDGPQPILVMEYCGGGSLDKLLFDRKQPLNEKEKINFVRGVAAGMCHLHNITLFIVILLQETFY
jgi:serine/threonine protein kinase